MKSTFLNTKRMKYCTVYFEQEKVVKLNSPNLFIIGIEGNQEKTYQFDKIFVNIKKQEPPGS